MTLQPTFEIRLGGQVVGSLSRNRRGVTMWQPDVGWERGGQRPRLGLAFLREPGPASSATGLPPWFENLLPEPGAALRSRLARAHGLRENDGLALLQALGADLPGAVEVRAGAAERAAADGDDATPVPVPGGGGVADTLPNRLRFSLAGMQLKFSMAAQGERLVLTAHGQGKRWIVKLPGREHPELPAVEAATMGWARAAGHDDVPTNHVVSTDLLDGLPDGWLDSCPTAYAIERFDRRPDGTRVHHEDFCQALNLLPTHKYGDTGDRPISHDGVLRMVADVAGEEAAKRFARRVGFVIASGNGDAHLKNWSFEWGGADRPALSPCYDFVATITWPQFGWAQSGGPRLGLGLGRVRRFARIDAQALQRHAAKSGQPWARDAIMEGILRARTAWSSVADTAPVAMRGALAEHWRRVPVLREAGTFPE